MSLATENQNQISALPAPPLLIKSSEGEHKTGNSLDLPQLTPDTVEVGAEAESHIADKSQQLDSYDVSYADSYDDLYDDSYADSYDDSYDAPAAPVTDSSVAALDHLLAPHPPQKIPRQQDPPKINPKTKEALEEMKNTLLQLGRDAYSWNISMFNQISDLSLTFIYFLIVDGMSADVRIKPPSLDSLFSDWK